VFDWIIVGAGAAGCVLANRLSGAGARVLLLEAGPRDRSPLIRVPAAFSRLFRTRVDWDCRTAPQSALADRELYWPRGRTLGGSTAINAMMHLPGHQLDYQEWEASGCPGWGAREFHDARLRMEDHFLGDGEERGVGGPVRVERLRDPNPATLAFLEAAERAGIAPSPGVDGGEPEGVGLTPVTQRRGRRWSAADAYLHPVRSRRTLSVRTGARATRILWRETRAMGVEYRVGERLERALLGDGGELVLSAGAVGSPQLLLLSGVGDPAALGRLGIPAVVECPGVGRNLQDHLAVGVVMSTRDPISLVSAGNAGSWIRYLGNRRGPLTSNVGEACAFVRSRPGLPAPDLELIFGPVPYLEHGLVPPTRHGVTVGAVLLRPSSRGVVELRSPDPLQRPRVDPGYLGDPAGEDLARLRTGLRLARTVLETEPLAGMVEAFMEPNPFPEADAGVDDFIRRRAETLYHPVGSCRMGPESDPEAVVDPDLRVRGAQGLRVVDASVFPRAIRGHTASPVMMMAELAAERLLQGD